MRQRLDTDPELYYQQHVFMCVNGREEGHPRGCCLSRGMGELAQYAKQQSRSIGLDGVRINGAKCLNRCELGPVMVIYPEGIWYSIQTKEDVDEILNTHVKKDGRVERLMLQPDDTGLEPIA
ncbi:MAG: ferredoxin [Kordiimonas sp.]|nr:ferredoxin [Kordiimonas sp.]|tara:strand:- start:4665 stop:5030 length:366 start_codon:yes stop_codon:yes gene_type:complete